MLIHVRHNAHLAKYDKSNFAYPALDTVCHKGKGWPMVMNQIKKLRENKGLTLEALAERVCLSPSYVQRLENGDRNLSTKHFNAFARALGVKVGDIVSDAPPTAPPSEDTPPPPETPPSNVRPADVELPNMREMPLDLPVYGTTAGSHQDGSVQISTDPIDYVRRPPGLIGVKDAYSLFVEGDSMSPRHRHGDLICVRADRKARVGDDVVVVVQNGAHENHESFIAELLKLGTDEIIIGKLNPVAEIVLKRSKIRSIHRVLTMADLIGV